MYPCFWRMWSTPDFRYIDFLKNVFSIVLGSVPPIFIIFYISQFDIFLNYLCIKFGEYGHQWNCEVF